jgi:sarcosine oxidase subunit alpha
MAPGQWPDLRVHATDVTEQWCSVAIVGPRLAISSPARTGLDVSRSAPFMTWRDSHRRHGRSVFRISFSGELAYEVNVPCGMDSPYGMLMAAGELDIAPCGTEATACSSGREGLPIVGQRRMVV